MNDRIVLVGAGNMATAIAYALQERGNTPVAVWSRTLESAALLGGRVGCAFTDDLASLPQADIVIISVADNALRDVAVAVAQRFPDALLLHTAGSVPMDALREAGAIDYGVLYPMQTVNKNSVTSLENVTTFIEGCNDSVTAQIRRTAEIISNKVVYATSEQRCSLHVAAVFACNFPNAVYNMACELLQRNGLPFDAMLPLIDEAASKVHRMSPLEAQTGPARRGDENVMNAHKAMLDDELANIYETLSNYIMKRNR
ncbi:MAG: DUF2520 domain-containing protein [Bacteroidaceae bacterium]|nr:DUF2520 domain-containing protein [Bacteroidaceae bacterium]